MSQKIIRELEQLIPLFCRLSFDPEQSLGALGVELDTQTTTKQAARARKISADAVTLERTDVAFSKRFPYTLNLEWNHPETLRLADLESRFGPVRVNRSLAIVGPSNYTFQIDDQPLPALLHFTVDDNPRPDQIRFRQVALRRMPPDPGALDTRPGAVFVVLADLYATENLADREPLPETLLSRGDLKELMTRLQPTIALDVPNHMDSSKPAIHLHFTLTSLDDLEPEQLLRLVPGAAALIRWRAGLSAIRRGTRTVDQLAAAILEDQLPEYWAEQRSLWLSDPDRWSSRHEQQIDRVLSAQLDALLSNPALKALQSKWLGLAWLVDHVDFSSGSRIEVYSAPDDQLADVMQRGFVFREKRRRAGPVPALVIVDRGSAQFDSEELLTWSELADRVRVPVFMSGVAAIHEAGQLLENSRAQGYLALAADQVCVRAPTDNDSVRRFSYRPSDDVPGSDCWGSSVWAMGALAAVSLAEMGHIDYQRATIDAPKLSRPNRCWTRTEASGDRTVRETMSSRLIYDEQTGKAFAPHVRALVEPRAAGESLEAKMVLCPMLHYVQRWKHQNAHRRDWQTLLGEFHELLAKRFPDVEREAAFHTDSAEHLRIRFRPQFTIRGEQVAFALTVPWTE